MQIYQPFERHLCQVTNNLEELDPVTGMSLDGMASKFRRGELTLPVPWALHSEIGFETRFHSKKVCNVVFSPLHAGYTKGNMLVNFREDVSWMLNLGRKTGPSPEGYGEGDISNHWLEFLRQTIRNVSFQYFPDDECFVATGEAKINSKWFPFKNATAVGVTLEVLNEFNNRQILSEIPVSFADLDFLVTASLWENQNVAILDNFVFGLRDLEGSRRLLEYREQLMSLVPKYFNNGYGLLATLKFEQSVTGVRIPIPQIQQRNE